MTTCMIDANTIHEHIADSKQNTDEITSFSFDARGQRELYAWLHIDGEMLI